MKAFKTKLLGLALVGLTLGACSQLATYETADLMNEQAVKKGGGFTLTPFGNNGENVRIYSPTDCVNFCIGSENPEYSFQTATISNNSGPQNRIFSYTVHNTLESFNLEWSYTANNNAGRKLKITVSGPGFTLPQSYTTTQLNGSGGTNQNPGTINGSFNFPFTTSFAGCEEVTVVAEILDGDNQLISGPITTAYRLIGSCVLDCEESFSFIETEETSTIIFSYTSEKDIAGANLVFTFAQAAEVSMDEFTKSGATMQAIMDLEACKPYTWTATVESLRCTGQGQSQINVLTDFKVNDVSKMGNNSKIEWNCID